MRLFVCLLVLTTGGFLSEVRGHCRGKTVLGGRSGSILYPFPTGLQSTDPQYEEPPNTTLHKPSNATCTWILGVQENQTVWIDVVHVDEDTSVRITFGNGTTVKEREKGGALFTGAGRTTVEWSWRNGSEASRKLHLRWNTSEDGHDPAQVPYTHSDNDPVSPSPDAPNRVTRAPDILGFGSASPSVHTVQGTSAQLGGGVSGSDDKTGPPVPQEGTHNGEEKAGAAISDLAYTDTHTRFTLLYPHTLTQTAPALAPWSANTKLSQSSAHTLGGDYDIAMTTGTYLNRGSDDAYTGTQTQSLTKTSLAVEPHEPTATRIYPDLDNGTEGALPGSVASETSSPTGPPAESGTASEAAVTVPKVEGFNTVTNSGVPMTASIDEGVSMVTLNQPYVTTLANAPTTNQGLGTEIDQTNRSPRSAHSEQDISNQTHTSGFDDFNTVTGTPAGAARNRTTSNYESSEGPTSREDHETRPPKVEPTTRPTPTVHTLDLTNPYVSHTTVPQQTRPGTRPGSADPSGSTNTLHHTTNLSSTFAPFVPTTASDLPPTSVEELTEEGRTYTPTLASHSPQETSLTTSASSSIPPSPPQRRPTVTPDFRVQGTVTTEESLHTTSEEVSTPLGTHTLSPGRSHPHTTGVSTGSTNFPPTDHSSNDISHANSPQSGVSSGPMTPVSISPSVSSETASAEVTDSVTDRPAWTERNDDPVTPATGSPVTSLSSAISTAGEASTPSHWMTSTTPAVTPAVSLMTTPPAKMTPTPNSDHITTSRNTPVIPTHLPTPAAQSSANPYRPQTASSSPTSETESHPPSTAPVTRSSRLLPVTQKTGRDWPHRGRVFVVEDQPADIKVETFQVLLQVILEGNAPTDVGLVKVEPFLQHVAGYQSQQVTWHSGPVLQTVVTFRTVEALSWLGKVESLLQEAGLNPLPRDGIFVGGVRVKNITVGGLHTDVCSWLFMCPSGFQCVSSEGNASCRSLCHTEYCKHHGICVHHPGQQPVCQCPVGEDFWYMGQRCDLRMTRQRLVGVCFGVLLAVAMLMAILSYLAVRRFKSILIQAKVDQTRSSYRRFNHFDELSARFWGRSWPGSEDSLDNPAFTRSDELLHMRALDRTCCYHDDTLSIASTYQDSVSHLNTVYPHSSQYRWDLSNYSLADCVVDSGKASDLSVCSWPIEPIQWTPFPLLQQLSRNPASVKASRPRSYCEGMELVDLEKSWTA